MCVPNPDAIHSQTWMWGGPRSDATMTRIWMHIWVSRRHQMQFGPIPKCDSVLYPNGILSGTQMRFSPGPKCDSALDLNGILSWTQMQLGPGFKYHLFPDQTCCPCQGLNCLRLLFFYDYIIQFYCELTRLPNMHCLTLIFQFSIQYKLFFWPRTRLLVYCFIFRIK